MENFIMMDEFFEIESVGLPKGSQGKGRRIPQEWANTAMLLEVAQSFWIQLEDEFQKSSQVALRQMLHRRTKDSPEIRFSFRKEIKDGEVGMRIYRVEDEYHEQT
tara:strand:+ start:357 stop:671 length:315 start_codon:yes stop_codon:yes gene_type:complete